jgi:membrane peptidoglycan carboxypeptidase
MKTFPKLFVCGLATAAGAALLYAAAREVSGSPLQARLLGKLAAEARYGVEPLPSAAIRFPGPGPYDQRRGYTQLPLFIDRLRARDFEVTEQVRLSPRMLAFDSLGLFAVYHETSQAGLLLQDCRGASLYAQGWPRRVYGHFDAVPPLLVDALLFIENRELLDPGWPRRNPAIEWGRLTRATLARTWRLVDPGHAAPGGSTLATQIEKYRHSPEGRTESWRDKLRQMASASLRAYLDGEDTRARRRQIVADYLDTVPLAAQVGSGEVNGIGDAMWAWYGRDFEEVNRLLRTPAGEPQWRSASLQPASEPVTLQQQAVAYRQALSLLVAQRRPSWYLGAGRAELAALTDSHLRLLAAAGVISTALRDAALPVRLELRARSPEEAKESFAQRKASATTRVKLSALLDVSRSYDLDRLDLAVAGTLDGALQREVARRLRDLTSRPAAQAAGLYGHHLLNAGDDPGKLVFSVSLYERGERANLLRVQADSSEQPFDINEGAKLDLGSTAKLRTLVSYLELVAQMHQRWVTLDAGALAASGVHEQDALGRWGRDYLARAADRSLAAMLEAAMERRYSASPREGFFTGGGLHHFVNFNPDDDGRVLSVREALRNSVNLVFIRLMRDVVHRTTYADWTPADAQGPNAQARRALLERFAESEGQEFVARFFNKYRAQPERLASAQRDGGAHRHPLEQWVVDYLRSRPHATLDEALAASPGARREAYQWLFRTRNTRAQDVRIRTLREVAAFAQIQRGWQRLGYPFAALTPSYATAIGASGDRPAALAELLGIIANDGLLLPATRVESMVFARATPYETRLAFRPAAPQRVLPPELARLVRRALLDVVEQGTARRAAGTFVAPGGRTLALGGKTGTGDHRFDVHGKGGRLLSSRAVDRTATFAFVLGERHFGTVMVHAHEPDAARFRFTSALAVQVLKSLAPTLLPALGQDGCARAPHAAAAVAELSGK